MANKGYCNMCHLEKGVLYTQRHSRCFVSQENNRPDVAEKFCLSPRSPMFLPSRKSATS